MTIDAAYSGFLTQKANTTITTDTYSTPGTSYFLLPAGTVTLVAECYGAGGGGGNTAGNQNGGGGGGAYAKTTLDVSTVAAGTNIAIVVPQGTAPGIANARPTTANVYYVGNSAVIASAQGGANPAAAGAAGSAGGIGGWANAATTIGTTVEYDGGSGGVAQNGGGNRAGSGGGGGAGSTGAGGTGGTGSGTTVGGSGAAGSGGGGAGGVGAYTTNAGVGNVPGGGGGGGGSSTGVANSGANGKIVITYTYSTILT